MARYFPGLNEALAKVDNLNEAECVEYMRDLYGTENLKYGATLDDVRNELRRQIREDFRDTSSEALDEDKWISAMAQAARNQR